MLAQQVESQSRNYVEVILLPNKQPSVADHSSKGGKARANTLTPEERREIARDAARARWEKAGKLKEPEAVADSVSAPPSESDPDEVPFSMFSGQLEIGDVELESHVLSSGHRVFTQREVVRALSGGRESGNLQRYLSRNPLTADLDFSDSVISFKVPGLRQEAIGYEATLLVEICDKYLEARDRELLKPSQFKLAAQAEIILRACAKVGIIALIDEATGYQKVRAKNSLRLKLQAFIAEDLQKWALMFPEEFWLELARLEGIRYSARHRPLRWGKYVMTFVYDALDKDIANVLREVNPNPRHRRNHHQWLTPETGRRELNNQIQRVIAIMRVCDDMDEFKKKFKKAFAKVRVPAQGSFDDIEWVA